MPHPQMPARQLVLILASLCVLNSAWGAAATPAQIDTARAKSLAWLYTHQSGDGSWQTPSGIKIQPTALALDGLANAGLKSSYLYASAQAWLANAPSSSNDSLARQVNALAHSGANVSALAQRLITQRADSSKSWGAYAKYQAGFPDTALGLDAVLASGVAYADTGSTLGFIVYKQNGDGGWPNSATEPNTAASRLIPTAHNVLTLSRYRASYGVDSYITNGVNWLIGKQKIDGGFAEDTGATTGSAYDTALVWQALNQAKLAGNAAAIGAQTNLDNAQSFLVNTQNADGSWGGDALATAAALQTFPAINLADTDKDGIPDAVESLIGTNPNVADARSIPGVTGGNGQSVKGLTVSLLVANATLGVPFNYTITPSGTPPYLFSITSGALPDGLSLAGSGIISGTPTRVGPFNFNYQVTDSTSASTNTAGQINVLGVGIQNAGDLNGDGAVDVADVLLAEKMALGLIVPTAAQLLQADVAPAGAPDGIIDAADVARIKRKALGLETF